MKKLLPRVHGGAAGSRDPYSSEATRERQMRPAITPRRAREEGLRERCTPQSDATRVRRGQRWPFCSAEGPSLVAPTASDDHLTCVSKQASRRKDELFGGPEEKTENTPRSGREAREKKGKRGCR